MQEEVGVGKVKGNRGGKNGQIFKIGLGRPRETWPNICVLEETTSLCLVGMKRDGVTY